MATQPFQFKQFAVAHHRATMPVGTDAVLLGAWAKHAQPGCILDVGTGSGIIALMLAQRFVNAQIEAIDYDIQSVEEAAENFANSPFTNRLSAAQADFRAFESSTQYDLIVSNPPYFETAIKPTAESRRLARHTDTLSYPVLLKGVAKLLTNDGCFCCVLPANATKRFIAEAEIVKLKANEICYIKYNNSVGVSVALMRFSFADMPLSLNTLVLYDEAKQPTEKYRKLVKDFYLWG